MTIPPLAYDHVPVALCRFAPGPKPPARWGAAPSGYGWRFAPASMVDEALERAAGSVPTRLPWRALLLHGTSWTHLIPQTDGPRGRTGIFQFAW